MKAVCPTLKWIFTPFAINQMPVKNRLCVPAMVTNYGSKEGEITQRLATYLEKRAEGGFGLITLEATAVHPGGKGFEKGLGLWDDRQIKGLSDLAKRVHKYGAKLSCQLYHAGRQTYAAVTGSQVVAPSAIPCPSCGEMPKELQIPQIQEIIRAFGDAAKRVREAGADAVELHGAHGYLIAQFVSPFSNRRQDRYGGPLINRMNFPLEVVSAVRNAVGADFPIIYRLSARERVPGGLGIEDSIAIAGILKDVGVDAIHVSTGVYSSMQYIIPPFSLPDALNADDAEKIKRATDVPVIVAGKIVDVLTAESIIRGQRADMVAMGRASIVDPELPKKASALFLEDIRPCITCNQGCIGGLQGPEKEMSCLVNPTVGKEKDWVLTEAPLKKKILVVGGGPAGLEAARLLAEKGHKVILSEKSDRLGGQFRLACYPPEKQPLSKLTRWQIDQAVKKGVTIKLCDEITRRVVTEARPDAVVIATGARPFMPPIKGMDAGWIVFAWDVLMGKVPVGKRVLIMGGGSTGCETADYLLQQGRQVTIVELKPDLADDVEPSVRYFLLKRLKNSGLSVFLNADIVEVLKDGVILNIQGARQDLVGFDTIVASFGAVPDNALYKEISGIVTEIYVIGDAKKPEDALYAIRDAHLLAQSMV